MIYWGRDEDKDKEDSATFLPLRRELHKVQDGGDPVAFNEKLQSIKLFTTLVDKLRERASSYLPFIREDMYYCEGKVLLGEFALYNYDGFIPFNPPKNRQKIGELLNIYNIRGK